MTKRPDAKYYAVPDPDDPERMTYWRQTSRGRQPWPTKAQYGPFQILP
jgi:hypothetical protein